MNSRELVVWNMRRLRVEKKLSQDKLAELAGVDRTYVSRLERTMENPSINILDKIVSVLGVSIAELFVEPAAEDGRPKPLKAGRRPKAVD